MEEAENRPSKRLRSPDSSLLDRLPLEICQWAFSYLSLSDYRAVALSSRLLRRRVDDVLCFVDFLRLPSWTDDTALRNISERCPRVKRIDATYSDRPTFDGLQHLTKLQVLSHLEVFMPAQTPGVDTSFFSRLTSLEFFLADARDHHWHVGRFLPSLSLISSLRMLVLESGVVAKASELLALSCLSALTSLNLDFVRISKDDVTDSSRQSPMPGLFSMYIRGDSKPLLALGDAFVAPRLTQLTLLFINDKPGDAAHCRVKWSTLPDLQLLALENARVHDPLANLTSLLELHMQGCTSSELQQQSRTNFAAGCTSLHSLDLTDCNIGPDLVCSIAKIHQQLTRLILDLNVELAIAPGEWVRKVAKLPQLKELSLTPELALDQKHCGIRWWIKHKAAIKVLVPVSPWLNRIHVNIPMSMGHIAMFPNLGLLPNLTEIFVRQHVVPSDWDIRVLRGFSRLISLGWIGCFQSFTSEVASNLGEWLSRLQRLALTDVDLRPDVLTVLAEHIPNLRYLSLALFSLRDEHLRQIAGFTSLTDLGLFCQEGLFTCRAKMSPSLDDLETLVWLVRKLRRTLQRLGLGLHDPNGKISGWLVDQVPTISCETNMHYLGEYGPDDAP